MKLSKLKTRYETLSKKEVKTKQDERELNLLVKRGDRLISKGLNVRPINQIHIFSHALNQEVTALQRIPTKLQEILNNNVNPRKLPKHGIWILQNPRLHFHRHYQLIIYLDKTYILKPVKDRQQFSIGFWHSLGVEIEKEIETPEEQSVDSSSGGGQAKQLVTTQLTTSVIMQQAEVFKHDQNMSASRAYMILEHRAKVENKYTGFEAMITGKFDARIILLLGGMVAGVAMIFFLLHGGGSPGPAAPPGPKMIL